MRTREEIEKDMDFIFSTFEEMGAKAQGEFGAIVLAFATTINSQSILQSELLLDIRDLLKEKKGLKPPEQACFKCKAKMEFVGHTDKHWEYTCPKCKTQYSRLKDQKIENK